MISIQLKDVIESTEVLKKLAGEKLRGKVAFQISKILKKLEDELTLFNSTRVEIIKKYSQTDENGELIADEEGNVKLKEESIEDFNKEIVELLNMEIKIDANKIAIEDIENIDFTPAEMTLLMPLIEE
jgi:septum formation topological specificity factor MinE